MSIIRVFTKFSFKSKFLKNGWQFSANLVGLASLCGLHKIKQYFCKCHANNNQTKHWAEEIGIVSLIDRWLTIETSDTRAEKNCFVIEILTESDLILYRLIALWIFYLKSFESNSIRAAVSSQFNLIYQGFSRNFNYDLMLFWFLLNDMLIFNQFWYIYTSIDSSLNVLF